MKPKVLRAKKRRFWIPGLESEYKFKAWSPLLQRVPTIHSRQHPGGVLLRYNPRLSPSCLKASWGGAYMMHVYATSVSLSVCYISIFKNLNTKHTHTLQHSEEKNPTSFPGSAKAPISPPHFLSEAPHEPSPGALAFPLVLQVCSCIGVHGAKSAASPLLQFLPQQHHLISPVCPSGAFNIDGKAVVICSSMKLGIGPALLPIYFPVHSAASAAQKVLRPLRGITACPPATHFCFRL